MSHRLLALARCLGGGPLAHALRISVAAHAVHLRREMWRRGGVDWDAAHDPRSLYDRPRARLGQT